MSSCPLPPASPAGLPGPALHVRVPQPHLDHGGLWGVGLPERGPRAATQHTSYVGGLPSADGAGRGCPAGCVCTLGTGLPFATTLEDKRAPGSWASLGETGQVPPPTELRHSQSSGSPSLFPLYLPGVPAKRPRPQAQGGTADAGWHRAHMVRVAWVAGSRGTRAGGEHCLKFSNTKPPRFQAAPSNRVFWNVEMPCTCAVHLGGH